MRFLVVLLLSGLLTCQLPVAPPIGVRFDPPVAWAAEYAALEACSGLRGSFARIEWWRAPDDSLGAKILARWDWPHRITLSAWIVSIDHRQVRDHEMLHDLLGRANWPGGEAHPPVFARCGVP